MAGEPQTGVDFVNTPTATPAQAFSKGMAQVSAGFFASAAAEAVGDPSVAAPIQQMGSNIAASMQNRWWQKEWETFKSNYTDDFVSKAQALQEELKTKTQALNNGFFQDGMGNTVQLDLKSPEGQAEVMRLMDNIHRETVQNLSMITNNYMESAQKYAGNPYVNNSVQGLMASHSNTVKELIGPSVAGQYEKPMAEVENLRASAEYGRSAAKAVGTKGKGKLDINEKIEEAMASGDVQKALRLLTSQDGQGTIAPYINDAAQEALNRQYEANRLTPEDEQGKAAFLGENNANFMNNAARRYLSDHFPGSEELIAQMPGAERFMGGADKSGPQLATADMDPTAKKQIQNEILGKALGALQERAQEPDAPSDYNELVNEVALAWVKPMLDKKVAGTDSQSVAWKKRMFNDIVNYLYNTEKVGTDLPELTEKYGEKKKGLFDLGGYKEPGTDPGPMAGGKRGIL